MQIFADRVSQNISKGFKVPPPPTLIARVADKSPIAFSYVKCLEPKRGLSTPSPQEDAFVLNVPLISARFSTVLIDQRRQSVVQSPGSVYLFDLTSQTSASLDTVYEWVRFHIPQSTLEDLAYEKGLRRVRGLFAKSFGQEDPILYRFALTMLPAITNPAQVSTAFVEYMTLALHEHVICKYGGLSEANQTVGGLAPWQIRRTRAFIETHLTGDPSIAELSRECGISAGYFARAFRVSHGLTPHQWITKRRLTRAKLLMTQSTESLAVISLMCGFVDQSHLGRHFLAEEGISPGQWRRRQRL
jgi:AraC family transcriptional regulator